MKKERKKEKKESAWKTFGIVKRKNESVEKNYQAKKERQKEKIYCNSYIKMLYIYIYTRKKERKKERKKKERKKEKKKERKKENIL